MKKTYLLISIFILGLSANSFAGSHCKYLSAKYANKAYNDLKTLQETQSKASEFAIIDQYCESCKDTYVKPIILEKVEYRPFKQVRGYASIAINGKEVDLAYLYLNGKNLGFRYNCKTAAASEYLFGSK